MRGQGDDRHRRQVLALLQLADLPGRLETIHFRHFTVHQDQLDGARCAQVFGHGGGAIVDHAQVVAALFQQALGDQLIHRVVFGNQDAGGIGAQVRLLRQCGRQCVARLLIQLQQVLTQFGDGQRLGQVAHPQGAVFWQLAALSGWAQQQHRLARLQARTHRLQPAGHAARPGRHQHQQGRVGKVIQAALQAFRGLAAFGAHAPAAEQAAQGIQGQAVQGGQQGGASGQQFAEWVGGAAVHQQRHMKTELGALARRAVHLDLAAHHLHQFLADGQAQATAAIAAGGAGVALGEGVEQLRLHLFADADAGVTDGQVQLPLLQGVAAPVDGQADMAFGGELQGVAEQVHQHLFEPGRVAEDALGHAALQADVQTQALFQGLGGEQAEGFGDQLFQVELDMFQLELAGLDPGVVEDVVDHRQQRAPGAGDGIDIKALAAVQRCVLEQLQHAQHAVQRGADLVAHGGQEAALGLVGKVGLLGGTARVEAFILEDVDAVGQANRQGDQLDGDAQFDGRGAIQAQQFEAQGAGGDDGEGRQQHAPGQGVVGAVAHPLAPHEHTHQQQGQ